MVHQADMLAAVPPVAVTGAITILGMELDAWVKVLTCIYTILLIGTKVWQLWRDRKRKAPKDE